MAGAVLLGNGPGDGTLSGDGLLGARRAFAEEAVESAGSSSRVGAEAAGKILKGGAAHEAAQPMLSGKLKGKGKGKAEDAANPAADPTLPLAADLEKGTPEQAAAAVKKLGELGTPRAVEILLSELSIGLPPRVAKAALDVLAKTKLDAPSAFPVLSLYAHHRSPELRRQALATLAALTAPAADAGKAAADKEKDKDKDKATDPVAPLLLAALSDQSAEVRAVAAQALGARRETRAEPQLIKLLLRKDAAAPAALSQIGGPDTARALAEMIGNVPDHMILETLGGLILRPDFGPEQVRVQVVKTIGKMPGAQTLDILGDYVKDTAKDKQRPSRIEAQKIIEQRTAK